MNCYICKQCKSKFYSATSLENLATRHCEYCRGELLENYYVCKKCGNKWYTPLSLMKLKEKYLETCTCGSELVET